MILLPFGAVFADKQQEINHLLNFVARTDCNYQRNGATYDGPQARKHMERKYHYYRKKIQTAVDFIEYSATRSTVLGKEYRIHCPGANIIISSDWLSKELRRYRRKQDGW